VASEPVPELIRKEERIIYCLHVCLNVQSRNRDEKKAGYELSVFEAMGQERAPPGIAGRIYA
jgi:hypothetical protein